VSSSRFVDAEPQRTGRHAYATCSMCEGMGYRFPDTICTVFDVLDNGAWQFVRQQKCAHCREWGSTPPPVGPFRDRAIAVLTGPGGAQSVGALVDTIAPAPAPDPAPDPAAVEAERVRAAQLLSDAFADGDAVKDAVDGEEPDMQPPG